VIFECAGFAEQGARSTLNDSYGWTPTAVFVADSAGDSSGARQLADAAIEHFARLATVDGDLASALAGGAQSFEQTLPADAEGMTTIAGGILDPRGLLWTVSQGDSLVVHVRDGSIVSVSTAHNAAHELTILGRRQTYGSLSVLSRYLAAHSRGVPEVRVTRAVPGDIVILMTDGAGEHLSAADVAEAAASMSDAPAVVSALNVQLRARAEVPADNAACVVAIVREGASA